MNSFDSDSIDVAAEGELHFLPESKNYCVCYIDIVNSTAITAGLSERQVRSYYSLFLNRVSTIVKSYGAKVIKTLGDGMLFYISSTRSFEGFEQALACCFALLEERHSINQLMNNEGMLPLSYRISADYGTVQIAANTNDMFGSTVNLCSKINQLARPNRMVIGGDLYRILNNSKNYRFTEIGTYKIDKKFQYPVYAVQRTGNMEEAVVTAHISPPVIVPEKNQARIMIVDDAEDILATYRMYLANTGYSVEAFNDAEEALAEFAKSKQQYALVVLDVRMPRINGLQLFQRMKAIDSKTRVMFVTALDAIEEIKMVLPGCDKIPVIIKPANREQFISKVSMLINNNYVD